MGIRVTMDMRELRDAMNKKVKDAQDQFIANLAQIGEKVVTQIRNSDISAWNDQSGALRSSIGYVVSQDGKPVKISNFERVIGPKESPDNVNGSQIGRDFAISTASLYTKGIALIIVAGMDYAAYVEKVENKTVLARGEIEAKKLVAEMVEQLNSKINAKNDTY